MGDEPEHEVVGEPESGASAPDPQPQDAATTPGRRRALLQVIVLAAGAVAAIWLVVRAFFPGDCGCERDGRRDTGPSVVLTTTYSVPVLVFDTSDGALGLRKHFAEHLKGLKRYGYAVVSPSEVRGALKVKGMLPVRAVALTFDEDRKDVLEPFLKALTAEGVPAGVFLDPRRLGKPGSLSAEDVQRYASRGIEFHCRMTGAGDVSNTRELLGLFGERLQTKMKPMLAVPSTVPEERRARYLEAGVPGIWVPAELPVKPDTHLASLPRSLVRGIDCACPSKLLNRIWQIAVGKTGQEPPEAAPKS